MREMSVSCLSARFPAFVFEEDVVMLGDVVAGRVAAATLARMVVRFLPGVGALGCVRCWLFEVMGEALTILI